MLPDPICIGTLSGHHRGSALSGGIPTIFLSQYPTAALPIPELAIIFLFSFVAFSQANPPRSDFVKISRAVFAFKEGFSLSKFWGVNLFYHLNLALNSFYFISHG
jgi:hypothetical protein